MSLLRIGCPHNSCTIKVIGRSNFLNLSDIPTAYIRYKEIYRPQRYKVLSLMTHVVYDDNYCVYNS